MLAVLSDVTDAGLPALCMKSTCAHRLLFPDLCPLSNASKMVKRRALVYEMPDRVTDLGNVCQIDRVRLWADKAGRAHFDDLHAERAH